MIEKEFKAHIQKTYHLVKGKDETCTYYKCCYHVERHDFIRLIIFGEISNRAHLSPSGVKSYIKIIQNLFNQTWLSVNHYMIYIRALENTYLYFERV